MHYKKETHAIRMARLLVIKKMGGDLSESQQVDMDQWCEFSAEGQKLYKELFDGIDPLATSEELARYDGVKALKRFQKNRVSQPPISKFRKPILQWISVAAILVCCTSIGIYLYNLQSNADLKDTQAMEEDVMPGTDKAILTLADGTVVHLKEGHSGIVVGSNDIKYSNGHTLESDVINSQQGQLLSLRTPRGGQYQVQLSDGTKVWLNADSELKYPLQFSGDSREVELSGEAYFEVTHRYQNTKRDGQRLPFIVRSDRQIIQVLGTSFNVNTYPGAPSKTTLLEGSVAVCRTDKQERFLLKPHQQLTIDDDNVKLKNIESGDIPLWKDGVFILSDIALQDVMAQIARWYNVEVKYHSDELKTMKFEGSVPRYDKLKSLLSIIEKAGDVIFELKDNIIIVKKKPHNPTAYAKRKQ